MEVEYKAYQSILSEAAANPGRDGELVAMAQEIVEREIKGARNLWEPLENGELERLFELRWLISHTTANGIAGLRAKAVAARIHSNGFCSTKPDDEGDSVDDLAFSLAGDLLGLPHNRRLAA